MDRFYVYGLATLINNPPYCFVYSNLQSRMGKHKNARGRNIDIDTP